MVRPAQRSPRRPRQPDRVADVGANDTIDLQAYRDRFAWHPEPELIGIRDATLNRAALEQAGDAIWSAALDYLFDHALDRATGDPIGYDEMRAAYYGSAGGPGAAPNDPTPLADLLDEFKSRLAPHMLNAWHPGQFSYLTRLRGHP